MKKKNSRKVLAIEILLIALIIFSITTSLRDHSNFAISDENWPLNNNSIKNISNITLILNYHDGENVTFYGLSLIGDISPYNATITALGDVNIDEVWAINGVFIKGLRINGTWYTNGDDGRNWLYYVDAIFPGISSSVYELNNNSIIEWKFTAGNPYGDGNDPDDDFWLYLGIILGILALCAIGLYIILKQGFQFSKS